MSAQTPEQEPSIEEILASIRQIISDDDEVAAVAQPTAAPEPESVAMPPQAPVEDILELKNPIPEELPPVIDMEDAVEEPEMEAEETFEALEPPVAEEPRAEEEVVVPSVAVDVDDIPPPPADSILNHTARAAAMSGFAKLADNIAITKRRQVEEGATLEDIVRDMLQPMLRVWLDENLPSMIERLVEKELEKLARQAVDD